MNVSFFGVITTILSLIIAAFGIFNIKMRKDEKRLKEELEEINAKNELFFTILKKAYLAREEAKKFERQTDEELKENLKNQGRLRDEK